MKSKQHYFVADKDTGRNVISDDFYDIFEFVTENKNAKINTFNKEGRATLIDRRKFLRNFLETTKHFQKFFDLSEIMIKRMDNRRNFFRELNLSEKYDYYLNNRTQFL